ncbi:unnamed protein product [Peniophora sp. CBMAI 1063]|nr:unnamed protein product [Peniophora sp. CBMAI 1063]
MAPGPEPDITAVHSRHLAKFAPVLRKIEAKPGQNSLPVRTEKSNFFSNTTRSLAVAFDWPNTLKNRVPIPGADWTYEQIPELPRLASEDEENARRDYLEKLKTKVRKHYTKLRKEGGAGGGKLSNATVQAYIDRVVSAMQPPPKPPRSLDFYQSHYQDRWLSDFKDEWAARVSKAAGDAELEELEKSRAGEQRRYAAKRWNAERADFRDSVRAKCEAHSHEATEKYRLLWGAPADEARGSRAWAQPEMGAFFNMLLNWAARRYGLAMALFVSGKADDGKTDTAKVFATCGASPGSQDLEGFLGHIVTDIMQLMTTYAREHLVGAPIEAPATDDTDAEDTDNPVAEEEEDLLSLLDKVRLRRFLYKSCHIIPTTPLRQQAQYTLPNKERGRSLIRTSLNWPEASHSVSHHPPDERKASSARATTRPAPTTSPSASLRSARHSPGPSQTRRSAIPRRSPSLPSRYGDRTAIPQRQSPSSARRSRSITRHAAHTGTASPHSAANRGRSPPRSKSRRPPHTPRVRSRSTSRHSAYGIHPPRSPSLPATRQSRSRARRTPSLPPTSRDPSSIFPAHGRSSNHMSGRSIAHVQRSPSLMRARASYAVYKPAFPDSPTPRGFDDPDLDLSPGADGPGNFGGGEPWRVPAPGVDGDVERGRSPAQSNTSKLARSMSRSLPPEGASDDEIMSAYSMHSNLWSNREQKTKRVKKKAKTRARSSDGDDAGDGAKERPKARPKKKRGRSKGNDTGPGNGQDSKGGKVLGRRKERSSGAERNDSVERVVPIERQPAKKKRRAVISDDEDEPEEAGWVLPLDELGAPSEDIVAGAHSTQSKEKRPTDGDGNIGEGTGERAGGVPVRSGRVAEGQSGENVSRRVLPSAGKTGPTKASGLGATNAWKRYESKRTFINELADKLHGEEKRAYTELVSATEDIIRLDDIWVSICTPSLPMAGRPDACGTMTRGRGAKLKADQITANWGTHMEKWWMGMQPSQRRVAVGALSDLRPPGREMEWDALAATRGYKGPFLLLWCMAHWILSEQGRDNFVVLAKDMAATFKVLLAVRQEEGESGKQGPSAQAPQSSAASEKPKDASGGRGARTKWATEKGSYSSKK